MLQLEPCAISPDKIGGKEYILCCKYWKRHSINFCVKANPIRQWVACEASMIGDFLLIVWFPWTETVCAPQA